VLSRKRQLGGEGINPFPTYVLVRAGFIPALVGSEICIRLDCDWVVSVAGAGSNSKLKTKTSKLTKRWAEIEN
jgi:hypothetical protein